MNKIYMIYDSQEEVYVRGSSRALFESPSAAKASARIRYNRWNSLDKSWPVQKRNRSPVSFNDQTRFEIHKFDLKDGVKV